MLTPGDPAPPFEAPDVAGGTFSLAEVLETHVVALYFFPKTFTPG